MDTNTGKTYPEFKSTITNRTSFGTTVGIPVDSMFAAGYEVGDVLAVTFSNGFEFDAPIVTNFSEVEKGYFVQARSGKYPTFGIKYTDLGSAAGVGVGDGIVFRMRTKAGFRATLEGRKLTRTDARADYPSDAVFANFREIATTGMGRGKVFRGGHPIRPDLSRSPYSAALMQSAGINTVVNMCDGEATLAGYLDRDSNPHASDYYKTLVEKGSVLALNLGMNFADPAFAGQLVRVLRFMATHPAPYFLHCKSGKDRTGVCCVLLEALGGASQAEIVADYMESYVNHFGVERGTAKYDALAEGDRKSVV